MKEKPTKRAWRGALDWADHGLSCSEDHTGYDVVYAETRSKARYLFSLKWDFEDSSWINIKVKRSPENDLYEPKPVEILSKLTDEQKKVIAHSNGNSDNFPGNRDNYYCSAKDPDLLKLVSLKLMIGPQHVGNKMLLPGNGYFYLTETGKEAAFSMLPRKMETK